VKQLGVAKIGELGVSSVRPTNATQLYIQTTFYI